LIKLPKCRLAQLLRRVDLDRERHVLGSPCDPRACRDDHRRLLLAAQGVADPQIQRPGSTDVASSEDSHPRKRERGRVPTREEIGLRVLESPEPVRSAGSGEVSVTINKPWNDRGTARVNDNSVLERRLLFSRADVHDGFAANRYRDVVGECFGTTVGEGRPAKYGRETLA